MKSDIEIARSTIEKVKSMKALESRWGHNYGPLWLKYRCIDSERVNASNLILVTAITPTKADWKNHNFYRFVVRLKRMGKKAIVVCVSHHGPVFGMKEVQQGGGYLSVPMENINLHFRRFSCRNYSTIPFRHCWIIMFIVFRVRQLKKHCGSVCWMSMIGICVIS